MQNMKYYFSPPTCSLAGMIALEATGAAYEPCQVDFARSRKDLQRISPTGKVPALDMGAGVVTDTPAIIYWLARSFPLAGLMPPDGDDMVRALSVMGWLSSTLHIVRRQFARPDRFCDDPDAQQSLKRSASGLYWSELERLDLWISNGGLDSSRYGLGVGAYGLLFYHWAVCDGQPVDRLTHFTALANQLIEVPFVQLALSRHNSPLVSKDRLAS